MATVFWHMHGMIRIGYMENGKAFTAQYYSGLLDRFDAAIQTKRPYLAREKIFFYQDNAAAHKAFETMTKLTELMCELLSQSPYSPDLAPCDQYLFPNLKRWLADKKILLK